MVGAADLQFQLLAEPVERAVPFRVQAAGPGGGEGDVGHPEILADHRGADLALHGVEGGGPALGRLPAEVAQRWVRLLRDHEHFVLTAKLHRDFTHRPRADSRGEIERSAAAFLDGLEPLVRARRLAALLVQLPISFHRGPAELRQLGALQALFGAHRLVLELRHRSWFGREAHNQITGLGYSLAPQWPPALLLVVFFLVVNWFGDSLDGTLARVRRHERPRYGFYIDHVLDAVGIVLLIGGLFAGGYVSVLPATAFLLAYYLLTIEIALATHALGVFRISYWKFGPTELRILLAIGTLQLLDSPWSTIAGHRVLLFDLGTAIGAVALLVTFLVSAIGNTRKLYALEPLPRLRASRSGEAGSDGSDQLAKLVGIDIRA